MHLLQNEKLMECVNATERVQLIIYQVKIFLTKLLHEESFGSYESTRNGIEGEEEMCENIKEY